MGSASREILTRVRPTSSARSSHGPTAAASGSLKSLLCSIVRIFVAHALWAPISAALTSRVLIFSGQTSSVRICGAHVWQVRIWGSQDFRERTCAGCRSSLRDFIERSSQVLIDHPRHEGKLRLARSRRSISRRSEPYSTALPVSHRYLGWTFLPVGYRY